MWFPLAFQVQYRDFYLLFYHLNGLPCSLQGVPEAFCHITVSGTVFACSILHNLTFLVTGIACTANVQCISM